MAKTLKLGYAVVGLGGIAERAVLPAFAHAKNAELVALVSRDPGKAKKLAARFGAAHCYALEDYAGCLANPAVQAVYLCSVNSAHAAQTVQAARAGKHVLCEKPMAMNVTQCRQMIQACNANQVRLMIAYRKYFEPASLALKKLVSSGRLGAIRLIHSGFTFNLTNDSSWHLDARLSGGGALVDIGVYAVNTVCWLAGGAPMEAEATSWMHRPQQFHQVDEHIAFQLTFAGGLVAQCSASFGAAQSSFIQLHGEKGWAALNPAYAYDEERRLFGKIGGKWFESLFPQMEEFHLELDAFADCVGRKRQPEPDGTTGMRDVAVMEAIYRAARTRRRTPVRTA